ncbi:hypothetical protein AB0N16_17140 [Streptomyces sp. NPDC051105]|uniref:hypothetical protein n=1 Tax=Streptomyces sp. NPDC051105 TaxID=3154843 RepID=UPI003446E4DE
MTTAHDVLSERAAELQGFRRVQRLAYECAEAVAARLEPGITEREAARMQRDWLRARGVRDWFHLRGTGAKFEEILVVTDSRDPEQSAFWLDDDLPWGSPRARSFERGGVRRWAEDK